MHVYIVRVNMNEKVGLFREKKQPSRVRRKTPETGNVRDTDKSHNGTKNKASPFYDFN